MASGVWIFYIFIFFYLKCDIKELLSPMLARQALRYRFYILKWYSSFKVMHDTHSFLLFTESLMHRASSNDQLQVTAFRMRLRNKCVIHSAHFVLHLLPRQAPQGISSPVSTHIKWEIKAKYDRMNMCNGKHESLQARVFKTLRHKRLTGAQDKRQLRKLHCPTHDSFPCHQFLLIYNLWINLFKKAGANFD